MPSVAVRGGSPRGARPRRPLRARARAAAPGRRRGPAPRGRARAAVSIPRRASISASRADSSASSSPSRAEASRTGRGAASAVASASFATSRRGLRVRHRRLRLGETGLEPLALGDRRLVLHRDPVDLLGVRGQRGVVLAQGAQRIARFAAGDRRASRSRPRGPRAASRR